MKKNYEELLAKLVKSCIELIESDQRFAAVLIMHEYCRFLYPVEPTTGFINEDP